MSSLQRLIITSNGTKADFQSNCDLSPGALPAASNFENYISGLIGGSIQSASLSFKVGAIQAAGTLTSTGAATADQTCTVCNVTFTAKTSGATGNQFNLSATVGTQAANIAAAINASANLVGKVTATASLGVVTITSVVPGLIANGLELSAGNLSNVAAGAFASGTDGTAYDISL